MSKDRFIILRSYLDSRSTANITLFETHLNELGIRYEEIEGTEPNNHDIRNDLFRLAEMKGGSREYPLFFILRSPDTIEFVGNWNTVQKLMDANNNPPSYLKQHPDIMTVSRLFFKEA